MRQEHTMLAKLGFADPDRRSELHDLGVAFAGAMKDALAALVFEHLYPDWPTTWAAARQRAQDTSARFGVPCPERPKCPVGYSPEVPVRKHWRNYSGEQSQVIGFADGLLTFEVPTGYTARLKKTWEAFSTEPGRLNIDDCWYDYSSHVLAPIVTSATTYALPAPGPLGASPGTCTAYEGELLVNHWYETTWHAVIVEVKAGFTPASDVVRQIAAYREGRADRTELAGRLGLLLHAYDISESEHALLLQHKILPVHLGEQFEAFAREQKTKKARGLSL